MDWGWQAAPRGWLAVNKFRLNFSFYPEKIVSVVIPGPPAANENLLGSEQLSLKLPAWMAALSLLHCFLALSPSQQCVGRSKPSWHL